jgi:hypothetical protein
LQGNSAYPSIALDTLMGPQPAICPAMERLQRPAETAAVRREPVDKLETAHFGQ